MTTSTHLLIRQGQANKLSSNATGLITFALVTTPDFKALGLSLVSNDGGGYFSKEVVDLQALKQCIENRPSGRPIQSGVFKPAFVSRSVNNSGFMSAVLVELGLLIKVQGSLPGRGHCFSTSDEWDSWVSDVLSDALLKGSELSVFQPDRKDDDGETTAPTASPKPDVPPKNKAVKKGRDQGALSPASDEAA